MNHGRELRDASAVKLWQAAPGSQAAGPLCWTSMLEACFVWDGIAGVVGMPCPSPAMHTVVLPCHARNLALIAWVFCDIAADHGGQGHQAGRPQGRRGALPLCCRHWLGFAGGFRTLWPDCPSPPYNHLTACYQPPSACLATNPAPSGPLPARPLQVRLIEHRRAHNILIELSGIRKPFDEIKVGCVFQGGLCGVGAWRLTVAVRCTMRARTPARLLLRR